MLLSLHKDLCRSPYIAFPLKTSIAHSSRPPEGQVDSQVLQATMRHSYMSTPCAGSGSHPTNALTTSSAQTMLLSSIDTTCADVQAVHGSLTGTARRAVRPDRVSASGTASPSATKLAGPLSRGCVLTLQEMLRSRHTGSSAAHQRGRSDQAARAQLLAVRRPGADRAGGCCGGEQPHAHLAARVLVNLQHLFARMGSPVRSGAGVR